MALPNLNRRYIGSILVVILLAVLAGVVTGCELGQFPSANVTAQKPVKVAPPTVISTKNDALLAVYQHLLSQAESYEAKMYLADFYTNCDNWSAKSEFFKDGSGTWYIVIDMTSNETWKLRPYWQQASWFVFKDGKVIPSNRIQGNALRIEAELQELSVAPQS